MYIGFLISYFRFINVESAGRVVSTIGAVPAIPDASFIPDGTRHVRSSTLYPRKLNLKHIKPET